MLAFFLLLVVSTLVSDDVPMGLHHLKIRLPLFAFPISIGLLKLREDFKENVLLSYATITTLVCLLCLGSSIHTAYSASRTDYLYNDALTGLIRQQSIYVALAVNLAIYIFAKAIFFQNTKHPFKMLLAVVFLFAFSYLLASRIMFAVLVAATLCFSFYYILQKRKYLEGATLVLGLVIGTVVINKLLPSTFNRYKELTYQRFDFESKGPESHYNMAITPDQWNGANFRLAAWTCGWEVFQSSPITGVGVGDKDEVLREKYREKKFHMALQTDKNVHSNYLDVLFSTGVMGFLVFLLAWVLLPLGQAYRTGNALALVFLLTFYTAWITEVYFGKNFGTMLAGFFIPFVLLNSNKK
ncbi:O-antigen ligase family protein [Rufibacter radiotolerans]|nr:O-antigen ligase family protein [Rufibacter radiotolerans]